MGRQRSTIEIAAPIEVVWEHLMQPGCWLGAAGSGWKAIPDTWDLWGGPLTHCFRVTGRGRLQVTGTTVEARCPDRLRWRFAGEVAGTLDFELDDLDALTFIHAVFDVTPTSLAARTRLGLGRRAVGTWQGRALQDLAADLGRRLGCASVTVRSAGDRQGRLQIDLAAWFALDPAPSGG